MFALSETDKFFGVSCIASACRSHLEKFARGSNLALFFEAVQSRSWTTFPESWHDYPEQYLGSFGRGMSHVSPRFFKMEMYT